MHRNVVLDRMRVSKVEPTGVMQRDTGVSGINHDCFEGQLLARQRCILPASNVDESMGGWVDVEFECSPAVVRVDRAKSLRPSHVRSTDDTHTCRDSSEYGP